MAEEPVGENPAMYVTAIVIHHSLTKDSATVSWDAIRRYHTEVLGWSDCGYHYGLELVGDVYKVMNGRAPWIDGAHCKEEGMNRLSLGICLVGNFDLEPPPARLWQAALLFVRGLIIPKDIQPDRVFGHREFAPYKSCPGKMFDMEKFREELSRPPVDTK